MVALRIKYNIRQSQKCPCLFVTIFRPKIFNFHVSFRHNIWRWQREKRHVTFGAKETPQSRET
jgi:hypothetical protein